MNTRTCIALTFLCFVTLVATTGAQVPGQNVNMVSGTQWPFGDPFLERQNEPSIAVSTRNPQHLLAAANDYRTVDLNLQEAEPGEITGSNAATGEPWLGTYISTDGGARWQSTLLAGYPQDSSPQGLASPLPAAATIDRETSGAATFLTWNPDPRLRTRSRRLCCDFARSLQ
jgi:hypothetical protein